MRRHLVVEVVDGAGQPVKEAKVSFQPEQPDCDLILRPTFTTDAQGRTPGKGQAKALLLTEFVKIATDTPDQPETKIFTYTIIAEKGGKRATITEVKPETSWKVVTLKLMD